VHISAKYTIMLTFSLHKHLHMYLCRRLPMRVRKKSIRNGVDIFCTFLHSPISILNLTMSSESQVYWPIVLVRTEIFSHFFTHSQCCANQTVIELPCRFCASAKWRRNGVGVLSQFLLAVTLHPNVKSMVMSHLNNHGISTVKSMSHPNMFEHVGPTEH